MFNDNFKANRLALVTSAAIVLAGTGSFASAWAADTAAAPAMSQKASPTKAAPSESPENRVTHLHDQLGITADQEVQWTSVASVMLDNASAVDVAIKERVRMTKGMTAIDDLKSYEAIVEAHADGIKKLAVAFKPLYDAMPVEQQKHADAVFARRTGPAKVKSHA
jgi:periplasmic protein CpxP/Spy